MPKAGGANSGLLFLRDHTSLIKIHTVYYSRSQYYLSYNGNFVCKLLGANTNDKLIKDIKKNFKYVKLFKPKSSMKDSKEIYLVCLSFNNLQ